MSVSALDGFYSTWNKARETFGVGVPTDGSQHDGSSQLLKLKGMVESAAPDDRWQGTASQAYAAANKKHAEVYQKLADLDQKMATEVTNAANVVANGRNKLDATKSWVDSAVNSLPSSLSAQAREKSLIPIANEGVKQVNTAVNTAHGDMLKIGFRVTVLKNAFDELQDQQFGPGSEKKEDTQALGREEAHALSPEEQAERDVEATLNGTGIEGGQAERVDKVLSSIKPGEDLTPTQDAYLTKMHDHQKGMSVSELKQAEQRLGEHKNVIADSWQLMSNDDVRYSGGAGEPPKGAASELPDSVQHALRHADSATASESDRNPELAHGDSLRAIADIVKDGNPSFQTGTELDRQIIVATDKLMDKAGTMYTPHDLVSTTQSLFEAVDDDHQIINDHLVGRNGMDPNDFLKDINTTNWEDNGKSARYLFQWTNESHIGAESSIAASTAEIYSTYIGSHSELMDIHGKTLGQLNPELVQGYAHGLSPYVSELAGLSDQIKGDQFRFPDADNRELPTAKGVFSVLATDSAAYTEFDGAVKEKLLTLSHSWASEARNGQASEFDNRMVDCATLQALESVGSTEAVNRLHLNAEELYNQNKASYEIAVKAISGGGGLVPGIGPALAPSLDIFGTAMEETIIGSQPSDGYAPATVKPMFSDDPARFALNALLATGTPPTGVPSEWLVDVPVDPDHPDGPTVKQIAPSEDIIKNYEEAHSTISRDLNRHLEEIVGGSRNSPTGPMITQYTGITGNPVPK